VAVGVLVCVKLVIGKICFDGKVVSVTIASLDGPRLSTKYNTAARTRITTAPDDNETILRLADP
jgi:hypothetical protein